MSNDFLNPDRWALVSRARMLEFIDELRKQRSTKGNPARSSWNFTDAISPLDVYCYLKARFGEPNGLMMALRSPTIENFCHWQYMVESDGTILDFMGLNVRTELRVYGQLVADDNLWKLFEARLIGEFKATRKRMSQVRNTFERWHLFVNPYARLKRIVVRNSERLREIDIGNVKVPSLPHDVDEFPLFERELKASREAYEEAIALATSLQAIAPIMGEAAINVFILLLAKPELKADSRLLDDFKRRNIDVRVKSLHLHCDHFDSAVSGSEAPFKAFLRLMNRRNDILHGNVDPRKSTGDEIYFDHSTIPLPRHYRTLSQSALANVLASVDPEIALSDCTVIDEFVNFLVSKLTPDLQPIVHRFLAEEQPGYRPDLDRLGVILPQETVEFVSGPPRLELDS